MSLLFLVVCVAATLASDPEWTRQNSGVTARLRGVSAVSDRVAWASGAAGTILKTVDGGETWQRLAIPDAAALDFRDIDAIDDRMAFVLSIGPGDSSRIYKTSDGGETWQLQFRNDDPKAFFDAMTFWSPLRGIAVSDSVDGRFVLIVTGDGGRTWTRVAQDRLPPALPQEGAFAASGSNIAARGRKVWIGTTAGRVLSSADGGQSWKVATTGLKSSPSAGIFSIAFRDDRHGIVVGGDYKLEQQSVENAAITSDAGGTWHMVNGLSGFRSAVSWMPRSNPPRLFAAGPSGVDVSMDDGRTWRRIDSGGGFHALSISPQSRVGWGVGENGRIARLSYP